MAAMEARGDSSIVMGTMEQGDEEGFILDIDLLQTHGINVADIKKLKTAGICTVRGVQMITKKRLCNIKGLSEAKVDKIKEAILKLHGEGGGMGFITALQVTWSPEDPWCSEIKSKPREPDGNLSIGWVQ